MKILTKNETKCLLGMRNIICNLFFSENNTREENKIKEMLDK